MFLTTLSSLFFATVSLAAAVDFAPTPAAVYPRAVTTTFPSTAGTSHLSAPIVVESGQTFDGQMFRFDRGPGACLGQKEGDDPDAVFLVQKGGTLKNVIIGPDQSEGVHCLGPCVIENDALTIKGDLPGDISYVRGGGARHAQDKMLQHNGCGHLDVRDFYAYDAGKVYRSCGNCSTMCRRTVSFDNVVALAVRDMFCGVKKSYNDICSVANLLTDAEDICNGSDKFDGKVCVQAGPITSTHIATTVRPSSSKTTKTSTTKSTAQTKAILPTPVV